MAMSVSASVMKGLKKSMSDFSRDLLTRVGEKWELEKYGFSVEEAMSLIEDAVGMSGKATSKKTVRKAVKKAAKKASPSVPLPFVGKVYEELCFGIKFNHGLHTQCTKECAGDYCSKCQLQADKNASGKPNYGDIRDRVKEGVSLLGFRDAKGKLTVPYANVVKKMGLDKETCQREAAKFGVEIPECHWVERKAQRGRPKKSVSVSDTDSECSKKSKRSTKSVKKDDLLAALTAATAESETSSVSSKSSGSRGRPRLSAEEKERRAAEKAKKAEARAAKKAAAEAEKAKKAEERAAKKAAADAEKAKKAEARAAKKAAAQAEKAKKAEERAAKKAEKEAKKTEEKSVTIDDTPVVIPEEFRGCAAPELAMKDATDAAAVAEESDDEEDGVECEEFVHDGVTYWKAGNTIYNPETQEEVGTWDPKRMCVVKNVESDGELSEEELSDDE